MLPMAKELRRLWRDSPETVFGRLNFHRAEPIQAALEALLSDTAPAVLVMTGEDGIGRGYVCEAAAYRAQAAGQSVVTWHLDLHGFEPDLRDPLGRYLEHLRTEQERVAGEPSGEGGSTVAAVVRARTRGDSTSRASEWAAVMLSLLVQLEARQDPIDALGRLVCEPPPERWSPGEGEHELLRLLLDAVTAERRLLIHVREANHLTEQLRQWLIHEAERHPDRLSLVLACRPEEARLVGTTPETPRLDLKPLELEEMHGILGSTGGFENLTDDTVRSLHRATGGRPGTLAVYVALAEEKASEAPTDVLASVETRLQEEGAVGSTVRELLERAALCGRVFPAAPILEYLEVSEEVGEAALDVIDDILVDELGWLQDLEFRHPAFPGHGVYTFRHPMLRQAILDRLSDVQQEMHAITLLRFFETRLPPNRRGLAEFFLALTSCLEPKYREFYERQLAWWIDRESAESLQVEARRAIEDDRVNPVLIWRIATKSDYWPPYRRLALANACGEARSQEGEPMLAFDHQTEYHLLRADLLLQMGQVTDALQEAEQAASLSEKDPVALAQCLNVRGLAHLQSGNVEAAAEDFEDVYELFNEELGDRHGATLSALSRWGTTLAAVGDLDRAAVTLGKMVETCEELLGNDHPDTLMARGHLADVFSAQGDPATAAVLREEILAGAERVLGGDHPRTLEARLKLGATLSELDVWPKAEPLLRTALEDFEQLSGTDHPNTTVAAWTFFNALAHRGEQARAEAVLERYLRRLLQDGPSDRPLTGQEQHIQQRLLELSQSGTGQPGTGP